jgi:hypothetical protein
VRDLRTISTLPVGTFVVYCQLAEVVAVQPLRAGMTDSAFEWSVGKLQELNFDGDADALAAYVNALIENNRDAEGGEPELLRSRARQELEDFLGAPDAATFVNGLMRHLSASFQAAQSVPSPRGAGTSNVATDSHLPDESYGRQSAASVTERLDLSSDSIAVEQPAQELNQIPSKSKSALPSSNTAHGEAATSDGKFSGDHSHSTIAVDGEKRSRSAFNRSITVPQENWGAQSKTTDIPSSDGAGQIDLRSQLSRSRAPSTKRPRDGEVREGIGGDWDGDSGRNYGRGRDQDRGRAYGRNSEYQRFGDRDRLHPADTAETSKHPRRTGPGGVGSEGRMPMRDLTMQGAEVRSSIGLHGGNGPSGFLGGPVGQAPQSMGYLPPPPPGFIQHMREMIQNGGPPPPHGFPPHVPGMVAPPHGVVGPDGIPPYMHPGRGGAVGLGGRGRGRGIPIGVPGRQSQQGAPLPRGRALASVLVLRNVPHDKLTLGAINEYFEKFGKVSNIQLRPAHKPDHAFIEFAHRTQAQSAYDCVDAVMGNRHVRLYWARESDFEQDGIPLSGVELAPMGQARKQPFSISPQEGTPQQVTPSTSQVPEEDPAIVLQRKRKEIAAAREEQLKVKTERQTEYNSCIAEQKSLFSKLEAGCSDEEKKELLKRIKSLGKEAEVILAAIKSKEASAKPNDVPDSLKGGPPGPPVRGSGRVRGPMSADFRPKLVRITGASVEGLTEPVAKSIFHDTVRATLVDRTWVLDFATRRAAESATKAIGVLKKRFGPNSVMSLSDSRPTVQSTVDGDEAVPDAVAEKDATAPGVHNGGMSGPDSNGTERTSIDPSRDIAPVVLTPTAAASDAVE